VNNLQALMRDILKGIENRQRPDPAAPEPMHDRRKTELVTCLRRMPTVPSGWRQLVHPRIETAVTEWSWGDGNLLLLGNTGCGKTIGAAALARRLLVRAADDLGWERARRIVFVDAARLAVAREQHGLGHGEAPLVERCIRTPLLFIDELGYLDKETGVLEQVVDARNKAQLPVVVASGMEPKEIQLRYGAATARKMMAMGRSDLIVQVFAPQG
jgi:hypothetical protein